jgi:hypothetical protein
MMLLDHFCHLLGHLQMSYSVDAHKAITRSLSFFNQNVEKYIGALIFHCNTGHMIVFEVRNHNFLPSEANHQEHLSPVTNHANLSCAEN